MSLQITGIRSRLGTRILVSFLLLALVSLGIFGGMALVGMKGLGKRALSSSTALGNQAVEDSILALRNQAENDLLRSVHNQAGASDALLNAVSSNVQITADYAARLWRDDAPPTPRKQYSETETPPEPQETCVYLLAAGVNMASVRNEWMRSARMDDVCVPLLKQCPSLNTICVSTESGIHRSYPWRQGRDPGFDARKRPWYTLAVSRREVTWTKPYVHAVTGDLIVTCAAPFPGADSVVGGVVMADLTLEVLIDNVLSTQIGELGYAILLGKDGEVIARPGLRRGDTRWDETYQTEDLLESGNAGVREVAEDMVEGKEGFRRVAMGDGDRYVAYAPLPTVGWSLALIVPLSDVVAPALATRKKLLISIDNTRRMISGDIRNTELILLAILISTALLVLLISAGIARRIVVPLMTVKEGADTIGRGDLDYRIQISSKDEIEDLANSFNLMTEDLKKHIAELTEATAERERMESELRIARDIQMGILPSVENPLPDRPDLSLHAILEPAREVGGDFYDFFFVNPERLCLVIGDVSGKGIPAALFMSAAKALLKSAALRDPDPASVLTTVNDQLSEGNESCLFVTTFLAVVDLSKQQLLFSNGGHNPPVLLKGKGKLSLIAENEGMALGVFPGNQYDTRALPFAPGDRIFLYTDGLNEAKNEQGEEYGMEPLVSTLEQTRHASAQDQVGQTISKIHAFAGSAPQSDDITALALCWQE